jgi:hypothetical protein
MPIKAIAGARARASFTTLVLIGLAACGTPAGKPDAGQPDPAYWGFADKECLLYDNGTAQDPYTIAVNVDTTTVGGATTYRLLRRNQGFETQTDWLGVTVDSLTLYRTHLPAPQPGTADTYLSYSPAPDYLLQNLGTMDPTHLSNTTATIQSGASTMMQAMQFALNVESVDPVPWKGMNVQALHYLLTESTPSGTMSSTNEVWLAPNVGMVQLNVLLPGTSLPKTFTLAGIVNGVPENQCCPPGPGCVSAP